MTKQTNKIGVEAADLNNHITKSNENSISPNLKKILATSENLKALKAGEIKFSEPILQHGGNAIIFPNTINVIQGQAGVHKSRLTEIICAAFLKLIGIINELLGFTRTNFNIAHAVVYVDTERNLKEQFPFAIQQIQIKAGYEITENPSDFYYTSLLEIDRKERFDALNEYLIHLRETVTKPLFVVLDVTTDCISDFNKTDESMRLIDLMNVAVNKYNATFLCIIHENPNSEKARGHLGTEIMNKASTVMQVGFEKDGNNQPTDLIRIKFLKCRSTARHASIYCKYSSEAKGLVLVNANEVSALQESRIRKANNYEQLTEIIENYLKDGNEKTREQLETELQTKLQIGASTARDRLKQIVQSDYEFFNEAGESCRLEKIGNTKGVRYKLTKSETQQ